MRRPILAIIWMLALLVPVFAVNPDEVLDNPVLENRARDLSVQIRCLVCQNQSIDDSDADLARDLRVLVREKLVEGLSDQQVLDFLVARYGEFVLLKPPVSSRTYILWGLPFALLLVGAGSIWIFSKRSAREAEVPSLSEKEKKALSRILEEK